MPGADASDRRLKQAIVVFAALLLAAIIASVHLSTMRVAFGSLTFGGKTVWRGHDTAFRFAALDPGSNRFVDNIEVQATLIDRKGQRLHVASHGDPFADVRFQVPADLERSAFLDVQLSTPAGSEHFRVATTARDRPTPLSGHLVSYEDNLKTSANVGGGTKGGYGVALYPESGPLVAGLENDIVARVTQDGNPTSRPVTNDQVGLQGRSDAFGLLRFTYRPPLNPTPLVFAIGEAPSVSVHVPIDARPTQLALDVQPRGIVRPGATLEIKVPTLPFRDAVILDVWAGGTLLLSAPLAATEQPRRAEVRLPEGLSGFVRVDAYRNPASPDETSLSRLVWVSDSPLADAADAALAALGHLEGTDPLLAATRTASSEAKAAWLPLLLTRYRPDTSGLPLLRSTVEERQAQLRREVARLRRWVHIAFVLTAFCALALATVWGVRHRRRMQQEMSSVIREAAAAGADVDESAAAAIPRLQEGHAKSFVLAVVALALAVYAVFVLLTRIRWE